MAQDSQVNPIDAKPLPQRANVVVVGGGLVGLEIVNELVRRGVPDIVLLEAGPDAELTHVNASTESSVDHPWLSPEEDQYFWRPWTPDGAWQGKHYDADSGIRRRLGGRSLYWYGICLPIEESVLLDGSSWPADVVRDLRESWEHGDSLYERVASDIGVRPAPTCGPHASETEGAGTFGGIELYETPRAVRTTSGEGSRWSAYSGLDAWRDPLKGDTPTWSRDVRVFANVSVADVIVERGRAQGVLACARGSQNCQRLVASHVVLCAGTIENSRLVIQAIAAAKDASSRRLNGLMDHIVQGFGIRLAGDSPLPDVVRSGLKSYYAKRPHGVRSNLFIEAVAGSAGSVFVDVRLVGEQSRSDQSYVECLESSQMPCSVRVRAATSAADRQLVDEQRLGLNMIWEALAADVGAAFRPLNFSDFDAPERTSVSARLLDAHVEYGVPATWSRLLGTEDHEGGTIPLGAMLNDRHELHAVRNLFVAGPSSFPRLGCANPAFTSLALARRLAAALSTRGAA